MSLTTTLKWNKCPLRISEFKKRIATNKTKLHDPKQNDLFPKWVMCVSDLKDQLKVTIPLESDDPREEYRGIFNLVCSYSHKFAIYMGFSPINVDDTYQYDFCIQYHFIYPNKQGQINTKTVFLKGTVNPANAYNALEIVHLAIRELEKLYKRYTKNVKHPDHLTVSFDKAKNILKMIIVKQMGIQFYRVFKQRHDAIIAKEIPVNESCYQQVLEVQKSIQMFNDLGEEYAIRFIDQFVDKWYHTLIDVSRGGLSCLEN